MLANLRTDLPCANSLIFPSVGTDNYVRIEEIHFGSATGFKLEQRSQRVMMGLWSLTALSLYNAEKMVHS